MIERFAVIVLSGTVTDPVARDAIAGDLIEEYRERRSSRGAVPAHVWMVRQLVLSLPYLASLAPRRDQPGFEWSLIYKFYGTLGVLVGLGTLLIELLVRLAPLLISPTRAVVAFSASAAAAIFAGFLAARIARRAPLVAALSVGVIGTGIGVGILLLHDVRTPLVYWVSVVVALIPATIAGGLTRAHQLSRSTD
jgi:hypothetical protein